MALSAIALLFTAACTPTNTAAPPAAAPADAPSVSEQYLIGVSDQLSVSVWQHGDLSVTVPVRPDGRITVPLVGDVTVGGITPEAVAETITKSLSEFVRDPQVTVIVVGINSVEYENRIRVTGAVRAPRSVPFRRSMTVLDLVLESGGISEFAQADRTILYRQGGERLNVDLEAILERGDLSTNYPLRPGDVITVPEQRF
jgi:polysaccharide export outer membrane protein